jgi:hypothetical protein
MLPHTKISTYEDTREISQLQESTSLEAAISASMNVPDEGLFCFGTDVVKPLPGVRSGWASRHTNGRQGSLPAIMRSEATLKESDPPQGYGLPRGFLVSGCELLVFFRGLREQHLSLVTQTFERVKGEAGALKTPIRSPKGILCVFRGMEELPRKNRHTERWGDHGKRNW